MAHSEYQSQALVIEIRDTGEAGVLVLLFTRDYGVVWARAEGVKNLSSKLTYALQVGTLLSVRLVQGKGGWKVIGAIELENYYYLAKERKDHDLFRIFVRSLENLKRYLQAETAEPVLFGDILNLFQGAYSRDSEETSPELVVDTLFMLRLGYLPQIAEATQPSSLEEVVRYVENHPKEARKNVEQAVKASHL